MQNKTFVEDDIYFNSKDIAKEKAKRNQQNIIEAKETEEQMAQESESFMEEDYYDEDYYNKMPVSPYSPIYDPFWGPTPMFSQPGWNSNAGFGYNSMMGSSMNLGIGYTWGNAGYGNSFNNPYMNPYYNPYNMYGNPYSSFGNPYGNPWGNNYYYSQSQDNSSRVLIAPRNSINSNYRSDAVNRQFKKSASQPNSYKKSTRVNFTPAPNSGNNNINLPQGTKVPVNTQNSDVRNQMREIIKPQNSARPSNNNLTRPSNNSNSWSSPSRPTPSSPSSRPSSPSRNRRY